MLRRVFCQSHRFILAYDRVVFLLKYILKMHVDLDQLTSVTNLDLYTSFTIYQ